MTISENNKINESQPTDIETVKAELVKAYIHYEIRMKKMQALHSIGFALDAIHFYTNEYRKFPLDIQLKGFENWQIDNIEGLVSLKKEIEKKVFFNQAPEDLKRLLIEKEEQEKVEMIKYRITEAYKNFNNANTIHHIQQIPRYMDLIQFALEQYKNLPLHLQIKGFQNWDISDNQTLIALKSKVEKQHLLNQIPEQEQEQTPTLQKRL